MCSKKKKNNVANIKVTKRAVQGRRRFLILRLVFMGFFVFGMGCCCFKKLHFTSLMFRFRFYCFLSLYFIGYFRFFFFRFFFFKVKSAKYLIWFSLSCVFSKFLELNCIPLKKFQQEQHLFFINLPF